MRRFLARAAFALGGGIVGNFVKTAPANAAENTITPTGDFSPLTIVPAVGQTQASLDIQNSAGLPTFSVYPPGNTFQVLIQGRDANDFLLVASGGGTQSAPIALLGDGAGNNLIVSNAADVQYYRNPTASFNSVPSGALSCVLADPTEATYKGRVVLTATDFNGEREVMRGEASGAAPMVGFLGASAVTRQTGASAAGIAAITDANAKAAISALQTALANLGLVTSPA